MNELELAEARASRWKDQGPDAESRYELQCAHWESLTWEQVQGEQPMPSFDEWLASRQQVARSA